MRKFNELMGKDHVRNHPMFKGRESRIARMRTNMQRSGKGPDLVDIFSKKEQLGLSGDRTLRAYLQEAAISARAALDVCDFPLVPQISYNNSKDVKYASHDETAVVSGEILFNVRFATISGQIKHAVLPVRINAGEVVPPSTLLYEGRMHVITQNMVDDIVQRNTFYQLGETRRMFEPPLVGEDIDRAVAERNRAGYEPRSVEMDGNFVRRTYQDTSVQTPGKNPAREPGPEGTERFDMANFVQENADTGVGAPAWEPLSQQVQVGPAEPVQEYPGSMYRTETSTTNQLYGEVLEQPFLAEQLAQIVEMPYTEDQIQHVFDVVSPMMETLGIRSEEVEWYDLVEDLLMYLGLGVQDASVSKMGAADLRKVALVVAEYLTGRRRFGCRRAATSLEEDLVVYADLLKSAKSTFTNESYKEASYLVTSAREALFKHRKAEAGELLGKLAGYFHFDAVPPSAVASAAWPSFVANMEKLSAEEEDVPSERGLDADELPDLQKFTPPGYELILGDMVEAEDESLDTFPKPYAHIEKNYILRRFNTCSRDAWLPHLVNDGFALNQWGPNRGRPGKTGGLLSAQVRTTEERRQDYQGTLEGLAEEYHAEDIAFFEEYGDLLAKKYNVSVTYAIFLPDDEGESVDSGSRIEDVLMDPEEIQQEANQWWTKDRESSRWWYSEPQAEDYRTGAMIEYGLHVENEDGSRLDDRTYEFFDLLIVAGFEIADAMDLVRDQGVVSDPDKQVDPRQMKLFGRKRKALRNGAVHGELGGE